ncbi:MAG TPA: hypothetical protein VFP84_40480, partial [Kofleriaceae bacterium]|nr:hypothetical protein [Kofleriaceae bacterium]
MRSADDDPPPATAPTIGDPAPAPAVAFAPLHVTATTLRRGAPDRVIGQAIEIDTDALTINGATDDSFVAQADGDVAVLFTGALTVKQAVAIHGARPFILVASGRVAIDAPIDASAHGGAPGPGAVTTGAGLAGMSIFGPAGGGTRESSGGGGGSHGTRGGAGGSREPSFIPGGAPGAVYGASPSDPLAGGSPGGSGGFDLGQSGGAGGGAIQISSAVAIDVAAPILVGGGGGAGGGFTANGGAGGGAGGEIVLEAPAIT